MSYETIIGLEIHVQLKTKTKMFCPCVNESELTVPNKNICPVCLAHPGVLPVINQQAVQWTILTGAALHCQIALQSKFDRKNYFYPDLPKGYQISQYDQPLCRGGYLEITVNKKLEKINLNRIHLEEDAGKLVHPTGANYSLVDYNRAGTPLMEIVTEPDLRSPQSAKIFLQNLRQILCYLKVSYAEMEKGHLRCDANISLRPRGSQKLLPKTEIKNLNSFKAVEQALIYEVKRQTEILDSGEKLYQATRSWDDAKGVTVEQRIKEGEADYRYFPEPDLPTLSFSPEKIKEITCLLPELPSVKISRFVSEFGLTEPEARLLTEEKPIAEYFEEVVSEAQEWIASYRGQEKNGKSGRDKMIRLIYNWISSPLYKLLNKTGTKIEKCLITPENFAQLMAMVIENKVNSSAAEKILAEMFNKGTDPAQIVKDLDLGQVGNESELKKIITKVISTNPGPVKDFQAGKTNALQFFVGQVMAQSKGKADPQVTIKLLKESLTK